MSDLEKMRQWLRAFPGSDKLKTLEIDYTSPDPGSAGLCPGGLRELGRTRDILGNLTVENRYAFSLFCVFAKSPGEDSAAAANAEWLLALQNWLQSQCAQGLAPQFGDNQKVRLLEGALYEATQEGLATYRVKLTVDFTRTYEIE